MKAAELEQFITQFFNICREAKADLERATEAEQYPNSAIQDLLHALELAPKQLDAETAPRVTRGQTGRQART